MKNQVPERNPTTVSLNLTQIKPRSRFGEKLKVGAPHPTVTWLDSLARFMARQPATHEVLLIDGVYLEHFPHIVLRLRPWLTKLVISQHRPGPSSGVDVGAVLSTCLKVRSGVDVGAVLTCLKVQSVLMWELCSAPASRCSLG